MEGLYDAAAARISANCPSVIQTATGLKPAEVVELLALGADVTALVCPLSDSADPVREAGLAVSQRELHVFGVTMALVAPGGLPQFETARTEIKSCLCGWSPAGASMPVTYAGGALLDYDVSENGGRLLWLLRFAVPTLQDYEVQL